MKKTLLIPFLLTLSFFQLIGQDTTTLVAKDSLSTQKDLVDLWRAMTKKKTARVYDPSSTSAILPAIGFNPSYGFLLGLNYVRTFRSAGAAPDQLSTMQIDGSYTTKRLVIARFRHNLFRKNGTILLQGNWQYTRNYVEDYGLGDSARRSPAVSYPIRFNYFRLSEKVYKKMAEDLFAGFGASFDMRNDIDDQVLDSGRSTPHSRYSEQYGFDRSRYFVNGLIVNIQYNTRDHPNRPYSGMYADLNIRYNTRLLGSSQESGQLYTEFRKYFGLSKQNPDHLLAFWYYGSYLLWGKLPYLELAGTAYDNFLRSGRAYTLGRFKGQDYVYTEAEYRFPIIPTSKILSGVAFVHMQTASERGKVPLFRYLEPGWGAGLRIHFNKYSRTYISIDHAWGLYGSRGFFFALNEAF
jgi:hypothetical protein